ncbi:DUF354 domain-containing protein [Geomonas azotofigens]|uniref:DUF354 domain-containing protein n=1 Tax=Geomonas azotofigens TaxID=2843196 RepID=UPI001C0FEB40|nr:DUF354 domain-containing protein [Geomonas azotofigens]MBU5614634.1 DUF354 domain-containing protein [Geomonas azotofigens]
METNKKKIWIDLDNSPHVPFFKPIIEELEKRGYCFTITARDCFQVCGLADLLRLPYNRIGRHYGKNRAMKVIGLAIRALQLAPTVLSEKPALALSHGSRSQLIIARLLGVPSTLIFDYEHAQWLPFAYPDTVIVPEVIPDNAIKQRFRRIGRYPGIKEDVYVPTFKPLGGILAELGIRDEEVVVTIRPPATEAHYHRPQSDELFSAVMQRLSSLPGTRLIVLPRNADQEALVRGTWSDLVVTGKIIIPPKVIDGLNLIWHSDLVISGGGTMNREAAALGVPVYSIFRGQMGTVDEYLATRGRLVLLKSVEDLEQKLQICKWKRPARPGSDSPDALAKIVDELVSIMEQS